MYFEALASGGGDDWYNIILLTATNGVTVTVSDGDEEIEIVGTGLQQAVTIHNENATYTISATMNGLTKSAASITTDSTSGKLFIRELKMAAIEVTFDDDFRGLDYTISDGTTTSTTQTFPATGNTVDIFVPNTGVWKISSTVGSDTFESHGANVTALDSSYTDSIHVIPDGKTVTPVNDIQIWLACANIKNKPYTELEEVLADENTLRKLLTDNNAIDYLKRSTDWKSGKNLIPIMTSINTPSGLCFASSLYSDIQNQIYYAFNDYEQDEVGGGNDKRWFPSSYSGDQYLGYIFDSPILFKYIRLRHCSYDITGIKFKIQGSNNTTTGADGTWTDLTSEIDFDYSQPGGTTRYINQIVDVSSNSTAYKAYRILYTTNIYNSGASGYVCQIVKFLTIIGEGLTDSELAMSYIGAYDYAADTFLSDDDWRSAIIESEYTDEVINISVPTMTSNTTPEGTVSAESAHSNGNYPAWKAFNPTEAYGWHPATTGSHPNPWIQYEFTEKEPISVVRIKVATAVGSTHASSIILKGSNDGFVSDTHTIQTLETGWNSSIFSDWKDYIINNTDEYKYYRIEFNGEDRLDYDQGIKLQFLGREAAGVQSWLKAAGISKPYTTLDEVIADSDALATLVTNHDAVDYLVTAKGLIDGITSSPKAMRYIGYRNYCADILLSDENWASAIVESDYYESVVKSMIPKMTSATTPSGNVTASSSGYTDCEPFKAFNDYQYGWYLTNAGFINQWIEYEFDVPTAINGIKAWDCSDSGSEAYSVVTLKGSNVDNDWDNADTLISDYILKNHPSTANRIKQEGFANNTAYKYYRLICISNTLTGQNAYGYKIQLFGHEDVDETKITVIGATNADIYYKSGNTDIPIDTLSGNSKAIDRTAFPTPAGVHRLYSTIANDPDNLSNDYYKDVNITSDTVEIMMMPEDALYWYGYVSENCEDITTANGWNASSSSYSLVSPTHNTNNIRLSTGSSSESGIGTKKKIKTNAIKSITAGITISGTRYGWIEGEYDSKISFVSAKPSVDITSAAKAVTSLLGLSKEGYAQIGCSGSRTFDVYGLWSINHNPLANFFSAAKDTVYYTQGGIDIVVAKTNELGEAVVDLSSIPSGVTLKSSVAKDPDNLSNDYTKLFIPPLTERFYLIPEDGNKMLYWYGWISDDLDIMSNATGWSDWSSGISWTNPTFNPDHVLLYPGSSQAQGIAIKNGTSFTKAKGIVETSSGVNPIYTGIVKNRNKSYGTLETRTSFTNVGLNLYEVLNSDSYGDMTPFIYSYYLSSGTVKVYAFWYE